MYYSFTVEIPGHPEVPMQMGELCCGFSVCAMVIAGLYHQIKTGEGQLVDLSLSRASTFLQNQPMIISAKCSELTDIFRRNTVAELRAICPIPTASCYKTKDGQWIYLLGVELPRHPPRVLG